MSLRTFLYRFFMSNLLSVFYSSVIVFMFGVKYVKCLLQFSNPFKKTLRLLPPPQLSDPRYGVHKYIMVNRGLKLHYVESGDPSKKLMLFLHGFPEFWYSWRYQILEFQKDYWCVAVDMRGYGDSEKPESVYDYKMELIVEDIRDFISKLGADKAIVVSHDWGGIVASSLRDSHPDILHGLVMLGSTTLHAWFDSIWGTTEQLVKSLYVFMFRMPWVPEHLVLINDMQIYEDVMITAGNNSVTKEDVECYKYWFGKPSALTGPINYYRANFSYTGYSSTYHEENIPFLCAIGERDDYLTPSILEAVKKQYAVVETKIIENSGHFCQQSMPEKVNQLIRSFLTKNNL